MSRLHFLLTSSWVLVSATTVQECTADDTCNNNPADDQLECGVYMAPSTLGDFTNLGIYTGVPLKAGEVVNFPEIAIPLAFRDWDHHPPYAKMDGQLWDRYIWEGDVSDIESFEDLDRSQQRSTFVPGVGCTVNSMLDLKNIQSTQGSTYETLASRDHHSAGAFTPYHSATTTAVREISPGTELLASYGESWIPWIPGAAVTQDDYMDAADDFLKDARAWVQEVKAKYPTEVTEALLKRLWNLTTNFPVESREFSVLPKEVDWKQALEANAEAPDTRSYWRSKQQVSLEWLQRHGKCQDHLKPGKSTIPEAGRGAFAARKLPEGSVVGYSPLIHVGERFMDFGTIHYNHTAQNYSKPDLVLNYSFGHKNSTLLLTPYGAIVNYINHAKEKANVRVQWPKEKDLVAHKPEWLEKDVAILRDTSEKIGLSFDYVALRDIEEGEEIFMDYGDEWQQAWDEHVANWKPPTDADKYVHSSKYQIRDLKTPLERREDPYPPNLHTLCTASYRKVGGRYDFIPVLRKTPERVHCEVVDRKGPHYTVVMKLENEQRITVHKVTRTQGIELYDKVFSQDWHLPQAFRHKLYIPDDIFPESWKNN